MNVLHGHTSEESAYVVEDFPHGKYRTKCRFWLEKEGGGYRRIKQVFIPSSAQWGKATGGITMDFMVLVLDARGSVDFMGVVPNAGAASFVHFVANGLWHQLTEDERREFGRVMRYSRLLEHDEWARVDAALAIMRRRPHYDDGDLYHALVEARPDDPSIVRSICQTLRKAVLVERLHRVEVDYNP